MADRNLAARYLFDVRTPAGVSALMRDPITGPQFTDHIRDLNLVLSRVGAMLRDMTGVSGSTPQFDADVSFQGHRLLNLGDPLVDTDGVNLRTLNEEIARLNELILRIQQLLHNEIPPVTARNIYVTRAIPTGANDVVHIGSFKLTNDAHSLDLAITVADSANTSLAKRYFFEINRSINSDWQIALPIADTGVSANSDNFDLDVKQDDANSQVSLRIRRTAGTSTAATALIHLFQRGSIEEVFIESTTTATGVTAPLLILENAIITQVDQKVGVNNATPLVPLHLREQSGGGTLALDTFHDTGAPLMAYRRARGTITTGGAQVQSNDILGGMRGVGWTSSGGFGPNIARIDIRAAENFISTGQGSLIQLYTTPIGSITAAEQGRVDPNGNLLWGTTSAPSSMTKGLAIKNGVVPSTDVASQHSYYSGTTSTSVSCPHFRPDDGLLVRLFRQAALTATSATAFGAVGAGMTANDQAIVTNTITRVNEIAARLQILGLLS